MISRKKAYYQGVRMAPYDLVKEFLIALAVVSVIVIVLAAVLSSPDEKPLTLQSIALSGPKAYTQTALNELDGNSGISDYGPPYNNGSGAVQYIGPISLQNLFGVHIPVDTAQDFVIGPLTQAAPSNPQWSAALHQYQAASANQQAAWTGAYDKALNGNGTKESPPRLSVPSCKCGPVSTLMSAMLTLGQRGAMDGLLLTSKQFYQTDYTRPLLFTADPDNDIVDAKAGSFNLRGDQWGVMNETGNYPGQAWLWLYSMFYQIPPYTTAWAANTDALAIFSVTILSLLLLFLPWIPGLNRLPRYLGVYRLIWRDYYREQGQSSPSAVAVEQPVGSQP